MSLKRIYLLILLIGSTNHTKQPQTILVFDYAGSLTNPGRIIDAQYERSLTYTGIQKIQHLLEEKKANILVLFCRLPGQDVTQKEKALFTNQMKADIYITLQIYQTTNMKSVIHFYYYENQLSSPIRPALSWAPFNQAQLPYVQKAKSFALHMQQSLNTQLHARYYETAQPIGFPCILLEGIMAPALCIELGIYDQHQLTICIEAITQAIEELCLYLNKI